MYQHPKMKYTYVGVDSHKATHTAVFMNCFYEKLGEITLSSTPSEFNGFLEKAKKYQLEGTTFAFGFEDISAYGRSLVKFLIGKKQLVKHVNANLVASERKSQNILHKTDSVDAECASRVLLNRFDQLPIAYPDDKYWILGTLVSRHNSLIKVNVMLKNNLHSLLFDHYPSYHKFFKNIDCNSSLGFYEKYPSPSVLMASSVEELTFFFIDISKGKVGEKKAKQIWNAVKREGVQIADCQEVRDFTIQSTVRQLKANGQELITVDEQLAILYKHFDYPLTSMKGVDLILACKLIAEIGNIERFPSSATLARYAGVAPVTYSSGITNIQFSNMRGNRKLNEIFFRLALNLVMPVGVNQVAVNPFFYEYYHKKIGEGKTKKQALKCVERRLVNIIWGIMKYKSDYVNPPAVYIQQEYPEGNPKLKATFR